MSDIKGCTTVRYPLPTHVFTTVRIIRAIIRTKHVIRKTRHSLTAVVLVLCTSARCLLWSRGDASEAMIPAVPEFQATNVFSSDFVES